VGPSLGHNLPKYLSFVRVGPSLGQNLPKYLSFVRVGPSLGQSSLYIQKMVPNINNDGNHF